MRRNITTTIWICCTSFVERVMREAVEKRSISSLVKRMTFSYSCSRSFKPTSAEVRDARSPIRTAEMVMSRVINSIIPPTFMRYAFWMAVRSSPCASYSCRTNSAAIWDM